MPLVKFPKTNGEGDTYINPTNVNRVERDEFAEGNRIIFNDGSKVTVDGEIEDVVEAIDDANRT